MILVTGAAGKTGRAVISALCAREEEVRALVHHDEQTKFVKSVGAQESIVGDMRDANTLAKAARGVRAIYHICPNVNPDEVVIGKAAIAAAQGAGVEHFVFHSVLHPQAEAMPHHWNKLRVEEALFESQLPYAILQPSPYMQNVFGSWQGIVEKGVYIVPYSVSCRLSMVDLEDVAQAAANVLTEPGHLGATYELAGPEVLTPSQIAEVLSTRLKRPVHAEQIAFDAWARQAQASGMRTHKIEALLTMFHYYDRYGLWGNSRVLEQLIRRAPTTFDAFVQRTIRERMDK